MKKPLLFALIIFSLVFCILIDSVYADSVPTVTVRITSTTPVVGQLVVIAALAEDDYLLANTKLYLDDINVQTCDFVGRGFGGADCSFSSTTLSVGDHTYYATTTDSIGNTTRDPLEGTKSFTVTSTPAGTDVIFPTVTVRGPGDVIEGQTARIAALAEDDYLLNNTKLYLDGTLIQTCDFVGRGFGGADCPYYKATWSIGIHTYYATTTDNAGNTTRDPIEGTKSFTVSSAPVGTACTAFTYSDWSTCQSDRTQHRTLTSSYPSNCAGGNPILTQSCIYIPLIPLLNQTCDSFTYSNWGLCVNGQQNRKIMSRLPLSCIGGNPIEYQTCNYTPLYTGNNLMPVSTPEQELSTAYEFAYQIGITTQKTVKDADLEGNLIRAHMAKMMDIYAIKVMSGVVDTGRTCEFNDIGDQSDEMKSYIKLACQLGIMGVNVTNFNPDGLVTRAEFGTVLSRILYGDKYNGGEPYYLNHLRTLKENGIIKNDNPNIEELRGYVMLMLMRAVK